MDLTSGYPFWPVRDGLPLVYPPLTKDLSCDVLVVGGGITGALVTARLTDAGIHTVLLDKREVGWGSTAANTALISYELDRSLTELIALRGERDGVATYAATRAAVGGLGELAARLGPAAGYRGCDSLYLASRARDARELADEARTRCRFGFDVELLTEADLRTGLSFRRPAALLSSGAARLDPFRLTHLLLSDAVTRGAVACDRTGVTRLESRRLVRLGRAGTQPGVEARTSRGAKVRARFAVLATGYETQGRLRDRRVTLTSTYAIATEPVDDLPGWPERLLIWETSRPYLYLRLTDDRRLLIGGEDVSFRNPAARDRLLPAKSKRLLRRLREFFPGLRAEIGYAWTGTFAETTDGLGFLGPHPSQRGLLLALGYGGNGTVFAWLAAEATRDLVLGRRSDLTRLFGIGR